MLWRQQITLLSNLPLICCFWEHFLCSIHPSSAPQMYKNVQIHRQYRMCLKFDDSPTGILTCPIPPVVSTLLNTETCFCPAIRGSLRRNDKKKNVYYCCCNEISILNLCKHLDRTKFTFFPQFLKHNLNRFHWQFSWNSVKDKHKKQTNKCLDANLNFITSYLVPSAVHGEINFYSP